MEYGLQLYTVRKLLTSDNEIRRVFQRIKALGYTSVQLYGKPDLLNACAKNAANMGLRISGILSNIPYCQEYTREIFELCKKYGIPDLGISSNRVECESIDSYTKEVNHFFSMLPAHIETFSYHNHSHEFSVIQHGRSAMDVLLSELDPGICWMPDTYWLHDGACDVIDFLEAHGDRVRIMHLKDRKTKPAAFMFCEVGYGCLNFQQILKTARNCGIREYIVEQDECDQDPMNSIKLSMDYLKSIS